ncbi:forkhead box protein H1 [Tiliqua scincoides]|uniref:forkhead box protein H1 n=1 Tax=Tiliqua scincoides TaxID=71010 RepID=UPI003462722C
MSEVGCSHPGSEQVRSKEGLLLASTLPQDKEDLEALETDGGIEDQESSAEESGKRARKTKKKYNRHPKPPYTYLAMIALVIQSSPDRKLKLSQIIKEISTLFPFFQEGYQGWKDSIRHNLSSNNCFYKVLKDPTKPKAKGNFWTVDVERIPAEALRLQNTPISRQEERNFAVDLAPYVLHGWPFHSSPAPQDPSASARRATCLSGEGGAQLHSPFSIDSLLSDFQDVGLSGKPKVGAEQLPTPPATSLDFWGPVPIFRVSSGPPILPCRPPCPLPALQPFSSHSSLYAPGATSPNQGKAGRQVPTEGQLAKRPRVLQASGSSGSAPGRTPPPQLPTSYTKCVAPNVVAPSHSAPFSAQPTVPGLPFYGDPTPCVSPMYWEVKAGHSLRPLPPPRFPADLDQTVPPNKTVFDIWVTHPADIVQPAIDRTSAFPRSALLTHLDHL